MKNTDYPSQNNFLISESPAMAFIADLNNRNIHWCNKTMENILGYSLKEMQKMRSKLFNFIIHPDDFQNILVSRHMLLSGKDKHETMCRFRKRNDLWGWFHGTAKVRDLDKTGKAQTAFCAFLEFNELNAQAQKALLQMIHGQPPSLEAVESLSNHQKGLLPYIAKGLNDQEIAVLFNNSVETIETHVKHIRKNLKVHSRTKLVVLLIEMGY